VGLSDPSLVRHAPSGRAGIRSCERVWGEGVVGEGEGGQIGMGGRIGVGRR